jgi:hypothetical protein
VPWALAWTWFHPFFVNKRVHERVAIGAHAMDVVKTFTIDVREPIDTTSRAHCGSDAPQNITRIALYKAGSLPLVPFFVALNTTTTLCFDSNDVLVGIETRRWFDGP